MEMLALRFHGPRDLRLDTVPRPAAAPGGLVVEVQASGVCGSDLHFLDGSARTGRVPVTLGHETAGRVSSSESPEWRIGDEVVIAAAFGCGSCRRCRIGRPNLCERSELLGVDRDGGWAEAVSVDPRALIARPAGLAPETAALAPDAGATAYHAVTRRGAVEAGDAVTIIGIGGLGSFAVQIAKMCGAAPVIAVDVDPAALERARGLGADELVLAEEGRSVGREVRMLTDGGTDVALEFVGAAAAVDAAVKSLRPGGRAVAAGVGSDPLTSLTPAVWATMEYELRGCFGSLEGDVERVLGWLADGTLAPPPVRLVPLSEAAAAILDAAQGRPPPGGRLMVSP